MTRFVVDCGAVLRLASEAIEVSAEHELLAPTLLRSQALSALHESVHRGELEAEVARERLARIQAMPIRLLGDAVLRRRAWEVADQLGWAETYDAEYVALTQLQADALVTLDAELTRRVEKGSSPQRRSKRCERPLDAAHPGEYLQGGARSWGRTQTPGATRAASGRRCPGS